MIAEIIVNSSASELNRVFDYKALPVCVCVCIACVHECVLNRV